MTLDKEQCSDTKCVNKEAQCKTAVPLDQAHGNGSLQK
jgi:hypothetical protein